MFSEESNWGTSSESQSTSILHAALFDDGSMEKKEDYSQNETDLSCAIIKGEEMIPKKPKLKKLCSSSRLSVKKCSKAPSPIKMKTQSKFQEKLELKMKGARFRWINEQLYTTTGDQAKKMFRKEPELFEVYHHGFSAQVSKWPVNPLERIVSYFHHLPVDKVVADFGCGEGKLAQSIPHKVFSFDLVAVNPHIVACNMANVPLETASVDICVFCLSLMSTNVSDFIEEGRRVLVNNGILKICEIVSRMTSLVEFVEGVESHGFKLLSQEVFSTMFVDLEFSAAFRKASKKTKIFLKPCSYKRR